MSNIFDTELAKRSAAEETEHSFVDGVVSIKSRPSKELTPCLTLKNSELLYIHHAQRAAKDGRADASSTSVKCVLPF